MRLMHLVVVGKGALMHPSLRRCILTILYCTSVYLSVTQCTSVYLSVPQCTSVYHGVCQDLLCSTTDSLTDVSRCTPRCTRVVPPSNRVLIGGWKERATANKPPPPDANSSLQSRRIDTKLPLVALFTWFHAFMRETFAKGHRQYCVRDHHHRRHLCSL